MGVARRRGRRRKKLLDDLKDRRRYSHLKEEALDRTMWRNRFGGGFGPVVRQNTELMNLTHFTVVMLVTLIVPEEKIIPDTFLINITTYNSNNITWCYPKIQGI
jgi:hypothetical protein